MPGETAVLIGTNRGLNQQPYKIATVTVERMMKHQASMQLGLGINCIQRPKHPDYLKLDTKLYAELRFYVLLHRQRALSGVYVGLFGGWNRERWLYRTGKHTFIRRSFADYGPSIGYQHAIGKYLRFNEGIMAGHHVGTFETQFAPNGSIDASSHHWSSWFSALWYIRMGVVF